MNRKILRALPSIWNMKVTSILDNKTYVPMSVQELFAELKAHEYELARMVNKATTPTQAGPLALAATQSKGKGKTTESSSDNIEEEFAMLMRKMRKFMKKKDFGKRFQQKRKDWKPTKQTPAKSSQFQKNNNDERDDLCYNCQQPGHFRNDCPNPPARRYHDNDRQQR